MTPEELISEGLKQNFDGEATYGQVNQGDLTFSTSQLKTEEGHHHDQWIQSQTTGGLETAKTESGTLIRSYAGGIVKKEVLNELGVNESQILEFLKKIIVNHSEKVRLYSDFNFRNGDFSYEYKVTEQIPEVSLTLGKETITYKDTIVFVHTFSICNVEI
jgi:hypothetical protein